MNKKKQQNILDTIHEIVFDDKINIPVEVRPVIEEAFRIAFEIRAENDKDRKKDQRIEIATAVLNGLLAHNKNMASAAISDVVKLSIRYADEMLKQLKTP